MAGGGGSETTATQQLAPQQSAVLQAILPTLQRFATSPESRGQSSQQIGTQIGALERALMEQGGSSGSSDFRSSTNAQIAALRQQQAMMDAGLDLGQGPGTFQGSRVLGLTGQERRGRGMLADAARGGVRDTADQAAQALRFLTSGNVLNVNRNPGLRGAVNAAVRPLNRQFTQRVLPNIRDEAILSGAFGGSRQGIAEGMATQGLQSATADATAGVVNPAYQAGLEAYTRGLALAPQTQGMQLMPGQIMAGLGQQQRDIQQRRLDSQIGHFYEREYQPLNLAREVASIAFGMPIGSTTTSASGGGVSPIAGGLGGAASGAAMGTMIMPGWGTAIGAGLGGLGGLLGVM